MNKTELTYYFVLFILEKAFLALRILCCLIPSQNLKGTKATKIPTHEIEKYLFKTFKVSFKSFLNILIYSF